MTSVRYAIVEGGQLVRVGVGARENMDAKPLQAGQTLVEIADEVSPQTHCWDGTEVVPRTAMGAALDRLTIPPDGTTAATLSGIPAGTEATLFWAGGVTVEQIDDGVVEITSDVPDDLIRIVLHHPQRLTQELEVTVDAA